MNLTENNNNHYNMEHAKMFILADIIAFHIVPLFILLTGVGEAILSQMFLTFVNPLYMAISSFIFGITRGFAVPGIFIKSGLACASIIMYYGYGFPNVIMSAVIMFIVYGLASFIGMGLGNFFQRRM